MTILALEFSSARRSAAVLSWRNGNNSPAPQRDGAMIDPCPPLKLAEAIETGAGRTHAFGLVEEALGGVGLTREQIEIIAVGLGPGSYTGIRVALSIAQGWQLARGVKLLGISSAACLAAQAQAEKLFGRVNVVIDAQQNEFYIARYEVSADGWQELEPLQITSTARMESRAGPGEIWVGPEVTRWWPEGKTLYPSAAMLGRLAAGRENFVSGEALTPIYLREATFVKAPPVNRLFS